MRKKAGFDAVERPQYLAGLLAAVDQARAEGVESICALEFGVATGSGLLELGRYAERIQHEEGIQIEVFGFDSGKGLPNTSGDYRDHPDIWSPGDYPMDQESLKRRLGPATRLILGDVSRTVESFKDETQASPIGFIAFDLDLYSSTREALKVLGPGTRKLRRVALYFDDTESSFNHRFAGALLAIGEFNAASPSVKIDSWRGIAAGRPFFEATWLRGMYIAHDLEAISRTKSSGRVKLI